ncbi:MAG: hypothetical protein FJZ58_00615 [Chlamydiae bacterium]|nr:hypothetical protein [Chlamydiota bacterium]
MQVKWLGICLILGACSSAERSQTNQFKENNERVDRIHRLSSEKLYPEAQLVRKEQVPYPWEENKPTKEEKCVRKP